MRYIRFRFEACFSLSVYQRYSCSPYQIYLSTLPLFLFQFFFFLTSLSLQPLKKRKNESGGIQIIIEIKLWIQYLNFYLKKAYYLPFQPIKKG